MKIIKSITEDNSYALTRTANSVGIKQEQVVQIVSHNGALSLFYYEED